ncbi:MAG: hypothetical protein WAL93_15920 [Desulfobacterales bacterium]|jgi:hypothetical protein
MKKIFSFNIKRVSIALDNNFQYIEQITFCNILGVRKMHTEDIKQEAYRLLDNLPDKATWDDLMYQIYVRQAIEAGLKDSDEGRTVEVKEVRKRFGLTK